MIKWIKNLRSTEKGKILFKFSLYLLFFFFVIVLMLVASSMKGPGSNYMGDNSSFESRKQEEEKKTLTYFDKQSLLWTKDYTFSYEVTINEKMVSFMGEKNEDKIEGFKDSGVDLIHYVIEDGKAYKVILKDREEIDLYEGLDETLFDFQKLFKTLNSSSASISYEDDKKVYNYEIDEKKYAIRTTDECIDKIEITSDADKYLFEFQF